MTKMMPDPGALDVGLTAGQSWLLLIGLVLLAYGLCALIVGKDERDYSLEVAEPPSNVTIVDPLPVLDLTGCDCAGCSAAAGVAITRLLPEVTA